MAKPQVYINLSQTLAIGTVAVLGIHYLNTVRDAVGIQKTMFKDRIKEDACKVASVFTTPFRNYF